MKVKRSRQGSPTEILRISTDNPTAEQAIDHPESTHVLMQRSACLHCPLLTCHRQQRSRFKAFQLQAQGRSLTTSAARSRLLSTGSPSHRQTGIRLIDLNRSWLPVRGTQAMALHCQAPAAALRCWLRPAAAGPGRSCGSRRDRAVCAPERPKRRTRQPLRLAELERHHRGDHGGPGSSLRCRGKASATPGSSGWASGDGRGLLGCACGSGTHPGWLWTCCCRWLWQRSTLQLFFTTNKSDREGETGRME